MRFSVDDLFNGSPGAGCGGPTNNLFVQYSCVQSEEEQEEKYNHIALAVATTCLISLIFVVVLQYLYKGGKIYQLEWDLSTITAGDYTVEFTISQDAYQNWYNNTYKSYYGDYG